jgi:accessory gene regulator protein AgrB
MFEMLSIFVGYFLFESDANNWWWTAYWIVVGIQVVKEVIEIRREKIW